MYYLVFLVWCIFSSVLSFFALKVVTNLDFKRTKLVYPSFATISTTDSAKSIDFKTMKRVDQNEIYHFEVYDVKIPSLFLKISAIRNRYKPIAKTGSRTYSSRSKGIDDLIDDRLMSNWPSWVHQTRSNDPSQLSFVQQFCSFIGSFFSTFFSKRFDHDLFQSMKPIKMNNLPVKDAGKYSIGLFVYMWVDPLVRKRGLGDYLLQYGMDYCRRKGDQFMLLVHDDNGSGKLIDYYKQRGFIQVDELLEKGMICKL